MNQINWTGFIVLATVLALMIQILIVNPVLAQGVNTTSAENRNNTKLVVDFKNHTMSIIDKSTNKTISVKNITKPTTNETNTMIIPGKLGNATTNETNTMIIPDKSGNATTNETNTMIIPDKSGNSSNLSNNQNLSERLGKLTK